MEKTLLAVDLGGTKCELAIFPLKGTDYTPVAKMRYACADYLRLEDIIGEFLGETGAKPTLASLGVAGVVSRGEATVTNLPWRISEKAIVAEFGFSAVRCINDLSAVCASLSLLSGDDLLQIQKGHAQPDQLIGVIAPGTGLGEGLLMETGESFFPRGTEGGHSNFAPVNEEQLELLKYMLQGGRHVSCESLIAGPGIPNLYSFCMEYLSFAESPVVRQQLAQADDSTPVIFNNAFGKGSCPICRRVVDLFLDILGSEAGNLALKIYARGGIYIGGGIMPRIADKVSFDGFLENFHAKGKMADLMKTIPVHLIQRKDAALLGAARYGRSIGSEL